MVVERACLTILDDIQYFFHSNMIFLCKKDVWSYFVLKND